MLLALLLILVGIAIVVSGCTYLIFLYDSGVENNLRSLADEAGVRPERAVLRGFLLGTVSQFFMALTYLAGFVPTLFFRPSRKSAQSGPPLILVHGLYHNPAAWLFWRFMLWRRGWNCADAVSYNSFTHSFEDAVDRLAHKVRAMESIRPGEPVALIGHSLGGLVIRGFLLRPESEGRVASVVTLGTPHNGSRLAALALGSLGRSLKYKGRLVGELASGAAVSRPPALSLFTPFDNFVLPHDGLRISKTGWKEEAVPPMSHVSLLYSPRVFTLAAEFIAGD